MWETWVWSLDCKDPLEKGKAIHSSRGHRVRPNWATFSFTNKNRGMKRWWVSALDEKWKVLGLWQVHALSSVQSLSRVWLFATPWTAACQASLSITNSWSLLIHVHWIGDAIQPSHPLSSPSPAFNLSQHQGLFQWVSSSHQVAKVLEFQLQHQSFQWISGLTSFRMGWLDLLAVQGTLKSLLQHHSSKTLILQH